MVKSCPICGLEMPGRSYYDEHSTVEYHYECCEGCGLFEEHFSYGAYGWVVGHHEFGFHGTDDRDHQRIRELVWRTCRMLARRRLRLFQNMFEFIDRLKYDDNANLTPGLWDRQNDIIWSGQKCSNIKTYSIVGG